MSEWIFSPLDPHSYSVVYIDPPWPYYGDPNKDQAAGKHYNLMSVDDIMSLPIRDLLKNPGVVFLWATCPNLNMGLDALKAWGLYYRGVAWVWVKTAKDGHVISGQGIRPSFVKPTIELVLVGSTQQKGRPFPLLTESMGQVVFAPRGDHSEKPDIVRDNIVKLLGDLPKVELFARDRSENWDCWGDEV